MNMPPSKLDHGLADLLSTDLFTLCQQERQQYQCTGQAASPATLSLFHRALHLDPLAQSAICELFTPQIKSWIGRQQQLDPEDIAQQAWLQFWRYAPNTPNLLNAPELGPILLYLRQCVKSTILMAARKQKLELPLDAVAELSAQTTLEQEAILRLTIRDCVEQQLQTDEERTIFRWRFEWGATPQEIVAHHRERFPSIDQVYQVIQRLTRRLRNDETLKELMVKPDRLRQDALSYPPPSLRLSPTL